MKVAINQKQSLLWLILFISTHAYSAEFKPGFIVSLEGDTVKGFLLKKPGDSRFDYCTFKTSESAEFVEYRATQISAYSIQGDAYYESRKIKLNDEPERTYFAKVWVKGKATLLEVKGQYFLEDSEKNIYLLEIRKTKREKYEVIQDSYKGILNWKFSDCKDISSKINNIQLSAEDLSRIFKRYNTCFQKDQSTELTPAKIKKRSSIYIGPTLGLSLTSLFNLDESQFFLEYNSVLNKKDFKNTMSLAGGISMAISLPEISEYSFFNLDFVFQKVTHESEITNSAGTRTDKVSVQYSTIQLPLYFLHEFRGNSTFMPTVEFGINPAFAFNQSSSWEIDGAGITDIVTIKKFYISGFAGAGIVAEIKPTMKIFLKGRLQYGTSPIDDESSIRQMVFMLSSGILFKIR